MHFIRSKGNIIKDIATKRLEKLFSKSEQKQILEKMTTGDIFEKWADMTAQEVSKLNSEGYSQEALAVFVERSTDLYADSYLKAMISLAPPE